MSSSHSPFRKKLFTKKEATDSLALVKKITTDIVHKWNHLLEKDEPEISYNLSHLKPDGDKIPSLARAPHLIQEIQYHIQELTKVGCFLQDLGKGIVIFPSIQEGMPGYLRWRLGEEKVEQFYVPDSEQTSLVA